MNPEPPRPPVPQLRLLTGALVFTLAPLALAGLAARASGATTAADVMARGEARLQQLQDYNCVADLESKRGKRVETGACVFWFKQPRMLRVKVTRGSRKGSEMAVDRSGEIRGHKGGIFKHSIRRMKADDSRLFTLHGSSIMALDWGSFFRKYHADALRPAARVTLAAHDDPAAPYQVEVSYPDRGTRAREVFTVDAQRWLIVAWEMEEDGARVERVQLERIQLDTGVADAWFHL